MSKEIFLYSEDKKYKCAVDLADSLDQFKCPDRSVMILFEERENGTYIIAQARDKMLETEKDTIIDELKMHNADFSREIQEAKKKISDLEAKLAEKRQDCVALDKAWNNLNNQLSIKNDEIWELKQQLAEKDKEIAYMTKQAKKFNNEAQRYFEDAYCNDAIYQDKISFAVEQLKKVLKHFVYCGNEIVSDYCLDCEVDELKAELDNQIKAIKEME